MNILRRQLKGVPTSRAHILVPLAFFLGLSSFCQPAAASHIKCGDVLTADTRLDRDILGCPSKGLIIGADGVTVDLNGHTIAGAQFDEAEEGISANGFEGLTIRNGRIESFGSSVSLDNTFNSTIDRIDAPENYGGIFVRGDRNVVRRSTSSTSFFALSVHGDDNLIRDNMISSAEGAAYVSGERTAVVNNHIEGRYLGLEARLIDGLVSRNVSTGAWYGFELDGSRTRVVRNTATLNDLVGFLVLGNRILLERNTATRAGGFGSQPPEGTGIDVVDPTTSLTRNEADGNAAYGIHVATNAIDGGRNKASGNGIADCVNIMCQ